MLRFKLRIQDFELGVSLGQGTVGEIFQARFKKTGQTVAVKILQHGLSQERMIRSRFEREITILERLRHPNIVEVYGGGETDGQLFYAMEFVDAGTVKDLLRRYRRLPWTEVATIARQVCSALQYAHNHGIIHRDLKPANLFLTQNGRVKLGDFGIARDLYSSSLTDQGLTVGTHAYMSPEQITADVPISGKTDLYALGCVLYEMLVGNPPFRADNFARLFEQHLNKVPPRVSESVDDIPPALDDLIAQLLKKDPEERPFNARIVQGMMRQLLDEASVCARGLQENEVIPSQDVGASQALDIGQERLIRRLMSFNDKGVKKRQRVFLFLFFGLAIIGLLVLIATSQKG